MKQRQDVIGGTVTRVRNINVLRKGMPWKELAEARYAAISEGEVGITDEMVKLSEGESGKSTSSGKGTPARYSTISIRELGIPEVMAKSSFVEIKRRRI